MTCDPRRAREILDGPKPGRYDYPEREAHDMATALLDALSKIENLREALSVARDEWQTALRERDEARSIVDALRNEIKYLRIACNIHAEDKEAGGLAR